MHAFSEVILPIERDSPSIEDGVCRYFDGEIVEDYNCKVYVMPSHYVAHEIKSLCNISFVHMCKYVLSDVVE